VLGCVNYPVLGPPPLCLHLAVPLFGMYTPGALAGEDLSMNASNPLHLLLQGCQKMFFCCCVCAAIAAAKAATVMTARSCAPLALFNLCACARSAPGNERKPCLENMYRSRDETSKCHFPTAEARRHYIPKTKPRVEPALITLKFPQLRWE